MKDIKNYEGLYAITEDGQVWGYKRKHWLALTPDKDGYLTVKLSKNNIGKRVRVHRLVAETYIPNPDSLLEVNHKDEDKTNNCVSNLEWCDDKYNNRYGTRLEKISKPVICIETGIRYYGAQAAADATGIQRSSIGRVCRGNQKTAGGYHWRYANEQ